MTKEQSSSREGEVLAGKYRLDALLGAGGMGEVYRAENLGLGRNVAIKLIRKEHGESADVVTRFLREARTASIVRHPNVVDVLDVGQADDGTPFIVQELLEGEDLAKYTRGRGGKLEIKEAISLLIPAIDAVAFAHARGVIHRDLKPENIFLARDHAGAVVPKLVDFGISRLVTNEDQRMTVSGMTIGTPAYMSPEQIRAEKVVDARSDVWSLGVILYEILAGVLPFQSSSHSALFVKIVTEPPVPLQTALPNSTPELAAVVEKCLQARPDQRYASAADLARDLRVLVGLSAPEPDLAEPATLVRVAPAPNLPAPAPAAPSFAVAAVVPELELRAPKPKPIPQPSRQVTAPEITVDYGDMSSELVPMSDRRLSLAEDPRALRPSPPQRVARATLGMRNTVSEERGQGSVKGLLGLSFMWVVVLAITAALTTFVPGEWPVVMWATTLDGAPSWVVGSVAGLALVLGFAALWGGVRLRPVSWGLLVAGPGLVFDGVVLSGFIFRGLPNLTGSGGLDALARLVFPWPTALVPVGMCMIFLRQAWWSWQGPHNNRTREAAIRIVIAALLLFGAVEIARGAESSSQAAGIAS